MAEKSDTKLKVVPCGDGLYFIGGDLFCTYKLLGTKITDTSVKFEYEKYYILVSWINVDTDGNERTSPTWQRIYK